VSPKGIAQSAGLMVNYLYKLTEIDQNHETYSGAGRVVVSPAIRALLKG
ncbi:MAG: MCD, Malonyl-CoA decarboxylase MCD, partial [Alphaproteobacteria bacterium]|nr:MCD, Malonyl-CoA decarboxylase MCD [Alphaproteobacteria bacterium]